MRAWLVVLARRAMVAVRARVIVPVAVAEAAVLGVPVVVLTVGERPVAKIARKQMNRPRLVLAKLHRSPCWYGEEKGEQSYEDEFHTIREYRFNELRVERKHLDQSQSLRNCERAKKSFGVPI